MSAMQLVCDEHPNATLIDDYTTGDMICPECGVVIADRVIDVGSEWRSFKLENFSTDPCRVGETENPLLNGNNLFTKIAGTFSDQQASYKDPRSNDALCRMNQSLVNGYTEIDDMSQRINLPDGVVKRAQHVYKQVRDKKSQGCRCKIALASASLYIACRQEGVPRTFKEICAVSKVSKKEIVKCFRSVMKDLETDVDLLSSGDFMSRFCSNLELPIEILNVAMHIAKKVVELNSADGRSPISIAAATIFMSAYLSEHRKTLKDIGEVAGVAEVTIRHSYKCLHPLAADLFPSDYEHLSKLSSLPTL